MIDHRSNTCLTSSMVLTSSESGLGLLSICCHMSPERTSFDYDDLKQDSDSMT